MTSLLTRLANKDELNIYIIEVQRKALEKAFNSVPNMEVREVKIIENDFDVRVAFFNPETEDHSFDEAFYFSINDEGKITRHDFSGESDRWGHIKDIEETVQQAFSPDAVWMSKNPLGVKGF